MLIAITGKKNHGKNEVGAILAGELNLRRPAEFQIKFDLDPTATFNDDVEG
jgi:hypothetical protein